MLGGAVTERLRFLIEADADQPIRAFENLDAATRDHVVAAERRLDQMGDRFTTVGLGMVAAAGTAGVGLWKLGQGASDLNESINAVEVAFGDASTGILALSDAAAQTRGLARADFNAIAVQFASMATHIAGDGGDVVEVIDELTQRGTDFASVFNLDVDEALALFQSGLAGQSQPLRRYGIDLSAAAVQAHALEEGIIDSAGAMTESERVAATYSLLMAQTAEVHGDFANTSGSAANQARILAAENKNLADGIGAGVVPMIEAFQGGLLGIVGAMGSLSPETQATIGRFAALGTIGLGTLGTLSLVTGQAIKMRDRFTTLGVDGTRSLNNVGKAAAGVGVAMGVAAAAMFVYSQRAGNAAERSAAITSAIHDIGRAADDEIGGVFDNVMRAAEFQTGSTEAAVAKFAQENLAAAKRVLELGEAQVAGRDISEELRAAIAAEEAARARAADTEERHGEAMDVSGDVAAELADIMGDLEDEVDRAARAAEEHVRQLEATADAARDNQAAVEAMVSAHRAAADSSFAVADATDRYESMLEELDERLNATEGDQRKVNAVYRDGVQDAARLADAQVRLAGDTATAQGRTLSAREEIDTWNTSMITAAAQARGPMRQAILDYIGAVNDVPAHVLTDIEAALDQGDIDHAEWVLEHTSRARTAHVHAEANTADAENNLNWAARDRHSVVYQEMRGTGFRGVGSNHYALGGTAVAGGIAGENFRPEIVDGRLVTEPTMIPPGSQVTSEGRTAQLLEALTRAPAGGPTTVINHWPAGTDPTRAAQAMRRYEKRNGPT